MRHNDTRMVLKPDSEFFRYFVDPSGKRRDGRTPVVVLAAGRAAATGAGSGTGGAERHCARRGGRAMSDFLVAIGLVFAIEGILFAAFPGAAKQAMAHVTGDAGYGLARDRHRLRGGRRTPGLAGARLSRRLRAAFPPQIRRFADRPIRLVPAGATLLASVRAAEALSPQRYLQENSTAMARLLTALTHAFWRPALTVAAGRGARAARAFDAGVRARPGKHRRRRREGDRRGGQHLDLAEGRGRSRRRTAPTPQPAAGLAVRGVLRGVLQEPPRPGRRATDAEPPAAPRQLARLRLRHRSVRHRRHQQPRHRRSRRDHRRSSTTARG